MFNRGRASGPITFFVMKYEVYHKDSGEGISYHDTITEALAAIEMYERMDRTDGTYQEEAYDFRLDIEDNEE